MLTVKDVSTLIKMPNTLLAGYHARVMVIDATEALCDFYEQNEDAITGTVVVVRSKADESKAAHARNTLSKVLFIFSADYWVPDYFSGVCARIHLPKALLKRAR